jgi:UDP-glucuronate 4-epimerase
MKVLVTGGAGFIGAHLARQLALDGHAVVACDNFNAYYTPALKRARVTALLAPAGVGCEELDITDRAALHRLMRRQGFDVVVNLAAQAGVRHSARAPAEFVHSNLVGFAEVLEACRLHETAHLLYASSSSVYGRHDDTPFHERDRCDAPISFYAATKAANELMAHAYAAQHGLAITGARLFTVYGPWGRPDMAYWDFACRMRRGEPVPVFGDGSLRRDFTYVDDAVAALARLAQRRPAPGHEVFNVGHQDPVALRDFVATLEKAVGRRAIVRSQPAPASEVPVTCADDTRLTQCIGPWPRTPLPAGLAAFVAWLDEWTADTSPGLATSRSSTGN